MTTYENRLVLFIDFLGFSEHVSRTVSEPAFLDVVMDAVKTLREVKMEHDVFRSQRMTHFSDSVVLSYRVKEPSAVFWLLWQLGLAVIELAGKGFLVRGGITVGQLHHTHEMVVGPALVEAYRLESKVARYPRVIVDPSVIDVARASPNHNHEADEEERYVRDALRTDSDGTLWFDYVNYHAVVVGAGMEPDVYPLYLETLGRLIRDNLASTGPKVLEKHLWLHALYSAEVQRFGTFTMQDPESEEQRAFVAALPLFPAEVAAASAIVAAAAAAP